MELRCDPFVLTLRNEPTWTTGSADNSRSYDREYDLAGEYQPSSKHGVICQQPDGKEHSCIVLAAGGASGVHEHSAVVVEGRCFLAAGEMLCSLVLPTLNLNWATKVDAATCFGVYYASRHQCLVSHGELEIARLNLQGALIWSAGGADIFTEGFEVQGDLIEAIDFNGRIYRFDIASGRTV